MTTAATGVVMEEMAGAPGFEPGIAGPKPAALPLGYAPPNLIVPQLLPEPLAGFSPTRRSRAMIAKTPARMSVNGPISAATTHRITVNACEAAAIHATWRPVSELRFR